jgi:hypothetical protein
MNAASFLELDFDWCNSVPDGKVCLNNTGELAVTKFAVEPASHPQSLFDLVSVSGYVYLAVRLEIKPYSLTARTDEGTLRRSLFEHTGGSYPEVRQLTVSHQTYQVANLHLIANYPERHQSILTTHWYNCLPCT